MKYGSVCSGTEAATLAWLSLGWQAAWFTEIDPFPSALLQHYYPEVQNLGDFTEIDSGAIDVLVGGTPCQSFSVGGRRAGLADPRGVLAFEFIRLAERLRPRWVLFENVTGLLSVNKGQDFRGFLGALGECGYGFAYRVFNAQYFGVPQMRRRLFVVGHSGDWRLAAAVLFDSGSLSEPPASRQNALTCSFEERTKGGGVAATLSQRMRGQADACVNNLQVVSSDAPRSIVGVRRLTPLECERLQGLPDNYTLIPYRGALAKDSPRYKAIGNSMAVPVMRWLGERIQLCDEVQYRCLPPDPVDRSNEFGDEMAPYHEWLI